MARKTLVVMCGLPGSGKSTLAHKLVAQCDAVVLSGDALTTAIHGGDYTRYNERLKPLYKNVADCILMNAMGVECSCPLVVVDRTCPNRKTREKYLHFAEMYTYQKVLVYFSPEGFSDGELAHRRMNDSRGHTKEKWVEVVKGMRARFEIPSNEEGWDKIIEIEKVTDKNLEFAVQLIQQVIASPGTVSVPAVDRSSEGSLPDSDSSQTARIEMHEVLRSVFPDPSLGQSETSQPGIGRSTKASGQRRVVRKPTLPKSPEQTG